MLEKLRHRIPEHWKTKLAPLAEWLILAEPQLRLTDDMDGDAIRREVAVYVKRCVRWQAKERQAMQARRDRAQSKWGQKPEHRPAWVLFFGFVGLAFLVCILVWARWHLSSNLTVWEASIAKWAEPSTLLGALAGAPVAFMIWRYRDQNSQWQIENQRKDINLKDFQKLAEWASGQHLQEDKVVKQTKRTEKATANGSEVTTETVTTREGSEPPDHARSVNKRTGGESLQVAAVYQLQAFLNGEFGEHFRRPAFQLLKSLWEGLVRDHVGKLNFILKQNNFENNNLDEWRRDLFSLTNTSLGLALNELLAADAGRHLHLNPQDIPRAMLPGLNTELPGLNLWKIAGLNLEGIHLQGANLPRAQLQGAYLHWAKLRKTNLQEAQLQGAQLQNSYLQQVNLCWARLSGANLQLAYLQEANLQGAQLQGVNLKKANLENAILLATNLHGANLEKANLRGAQLFGAFIGSTTRIIGATYDKNTQFGLWVEDADAKAAEQLWRALGARRDDEEPTKDK